MRVSGGCARCCSHARGVRPCASLTCTKNNRTPIPMLSSASGTPMNISSALIGDVVAIPGLQLARRHPGGRSTLKPSSALVQRVKPGATVGVGDGGAVGVAASVAVARGLLLVVGVGDGADAGDVHATSVAVATSSAMSLIRPPVDRGLASKPINAPIPYRA